MYSTLYEYVQYGYCVQYLKTLSLFTEQDFESFQYLLEFALALQHQVPPNTTAASYIEQLRSEYQSLPAENDSDISSIGSGSSNGTGGGTSLAPSSSGRTGQTGRTGRTVGPRSDRSDALSVVSSLTGATTPSSGYGSLGVSSSSATSSLMQRPRQQTSSGAGPRTNRPPGFHPEAYETSASTSGISPTPAANRSDSNSSRQSTRSNGSDSSDRIFTGTVTSKRILTMPG